MVSIGNIILVCNLMFCTVTALSRRPSPYNVQQQLNPAGSMVQLPRYRPNEVNSYFVCPEGCICKRPYVRDTVRFKCQVILPF
uniref:Secreted protein n=1 Tax=Anopheles funestus TaxID=62324 RepID=A0A182S1G3_ANOFN